MAKPGNQDPTLIRDKTKEASDAAKDLTKNIDNSTKSVSELLNALQKSKASLLSQGKEYKANWFEIEDQIKRTNSVLTKFAFPIDFAKEKLEQTQERTEKIELVMENVNKRINAQIQALKEVEIKKQKIKDKEEELLKLAALKQSAEGVFGKQQESELSEIIKQQEALRKKGIEDYNQNKGRKETTDKINQLETQRIALIEKQQKSLSIFSEAEKQKYESILKEKKVDDETLKTLNNKSTVLARLIEHNKERYGLLKNELNVSKQQEEIIAKQKVALEATLFIYKEIEKANLFLKEAYNDYDKLVASNAVKQGILRSESVKQLDILNKTVTQSKSLTLNVEQLAEASAEINKSFGVLAGEYMPEAAQKVTELSNAIGISKAESAKFFETLSQIGNTSFQSQQNMAGFADAVAKASGVPLGTIINDVSKAGNNLRLIFKGNTEELIKQTAELRRMGSSLDSAAKSAESLLNFESSIGAELKLSALLGQSVNLNEARRLFFAGRVKEGEQAIIKELEKIGDLDKLNYFQRKALSDATGKDFETLQKMASQKKTLLEIDRQNPELAKERQKYEEELKKLQGNSIEQKERANKLAAMENVAKARANLLEEQRKQLLISIGKVLEPIKNFIFDIQLKITKFLNDFVNSGLGKFLILTVGGIVLTIGALGGLVIAIGTTIKTFLLLKGAFSAVGVGIKTMFGLKKATELAGEGAAKGVSGISRFSRGMSRLGAGASRLSSGLAPLTTQLLKAAAAFAIFAAGIIGIAYAFTLIKDVPIEQMLTFGLVLSGLLAVISMTAEGMSKNKASFAAMAGLTLSIIGIAYAFSLLEKVSVEKMFSFAGAISILGIALAGMGRIIGESKNALIGVGVISLSIAGIAASFSLLEKVSVEQIKTFGLTVGLLATALVGLGYAVANPVAAIGIGIITASIMALGASMFIAGIGIKLMGDAVSNVVSKISKFANVIVDLVEKGFKSFVDVLKQIPAVILSVTDSLIKISSASPAILGAAVSFSALGLSLIAFGVIIKLFPTKDFKDISTSIVQITTSTNDLANSLSKAKDSISIIEKIGDSFSKITSSSVISQINDLIESLKKLGTISEIKFPSINIKEDELVKITTLGERLIGIYPILRDFSNLPTISIKFEGLDDSLLSLNKLSSSLLKFSFAISNPLLSFGIGFLSKTITNISSSIDSTDKSFDKILNNIKNISGEGIRTIISVFKELSNIKPVNLEINIKGLTNDLISKVQKLIETFKNLNLTANALKSLSSLTIPKFDIDTSELSNNLLTKIKKSFSFSFKEIGDDVNNFINLIKNISITPIPKFDFNIVGLTDSLINKLKDFGLSSKNIEIIGESLKLISGISIPPMELVIKGLTDDIIEKIKNLADQTNKIKLFSDSLKLISSIVIPPFQFIIKGLDDDLIEKIKNILKTSDKLTVFANSLKNISNISIPKINFDIVGLTDDLINRINQFISSDKGIQSITSALINLSKVTIPAFEFNIKGLSEDLISKINTFISLDKGIQSITSALINLSKITIPSFEFVISGLNEDLINKIKEFKSSIVDIKPLISNLSKLIIPPFNFIINGLNEDLISKLKQFTSSSKNIETITFSLSNLSKITIPPFNFIINGLNDDLISKINEFTSSSKNIETINSSLDNLSKITIPSFEFNIKGLNEDLISKINQFVFSSKNIETITSSLSNLSKITIPSFEFNIKGLNDELIDKLKTFILLGKDIQPIILSLSNLSKLVIPSFELNIKTNGFIDQIDRTVLGINLISDSIKSLSNTLVTFPINQLREMFDKMVLFGQSGLNIKNSTDIVKELSTINLSNINIDIKGVDSKLSSQFEALEVSSENIKTNLVSLKELSNIELPKLDIDTKSVETLSKLNESKEKQTTTIENALNNMSSKIDSLVNSMVNGNIGIYLDGTKVNSVLNSSKLIRGTSGQITKD